VPVMRVMPMVSPGAGGAAPRPAADAVRRATPADPYLGLDPGACAGVDEVGRGSLFGPVFAAAVQLPAEAHAPLAAAGLTDSKRLSARRRAALVPLIEAWASDYALGQASAAEIDRLGIRPATELAMLRALQRRPWRPRLVVVDGTLPLRPWSGPQCTLVAGDRHCLAIAAASVLAKQARDALITRLAQRYPGYGLERHAGYGTAAHRQALLALGLTPLHRRSFLGTLSATQLPVWNPPVATDQSR